MKQLSQEKHFHQMVTKHADKTTLQVTHYELRTTGNCKLFITDFIKIND